MTGHRCMWSMVGHPVCAKPATHGTVVRDDAYYLCTYHAGRARRDGWRGVQKLNSAA